MKKLFFLLLCILFAVPVFGKTPITVTLDGVTLKFDQDPIILDGRTMAPVRKIAEALGALVVWEEKTETITFYRNEDRILLTVGQPLLVKNGKEIPLDVAPVVYQGRTMVPVQAVGEAFGCDVSWDGDANKVTILSLSTVISSDLESPSEITQILLEGILKSYLNPTLPQNKRLKSYRVKEIEILEGNLQEFIASATIEGAVPEEVVPTHEIGKIGFLRKDGVLNNGILQMKVKKVAEKSYKIVEMGPSVIKTTTGPIYENSYYGFTVTLPQSYIGLYDVTEGEKETLFWNIRNKEAGWGGLLFHIQYYSQEEWKEKEKFIPKNAGIFPLENVVAVLFPPSDVQYNLQDESLWEEYHRMEVEIPSIVKSFQNKK